MRPLGRAPRRLGATLLLSVAAWASFPSASQAAVGFRSASCTGATSANDTDTLTVTKPAGTVSGDLLIATLTSFDNDTVITPPAGWTTVLSDGGINDHTITLRKMAGGSEPASYVFSHPDADVSIANMTAWTGVDPAAPIAPTPTRATGSGTTWSLPDATSARWGSMRYTAVQSDANVTSSYSAGLTEACDFGIGTWAVSAAYEPTNLGTTAARSVTRSGTAATLAHTLVLQPLDYCGTGGLSVTTPDSLTFPTTALTGYNQTLVTTPSFTIEDERGTGVGWNLSATSTTFTSGSDVLPTSATTLVSATPSNGVGFCEAPSNAVGFPLTLPAGTTAPAAAKIFSAATNSGLGAVTVQYAAHLTVPGNTRAGTYTSTWTFTLATGP